MNKTDVFDHNGTEIQNGDWIEVLIPQKSIYSDLVLARGEVFFKHGSFRVHKDNLPDALCPRLDDYSPDCVIKIQRSETHE